MDNEDRERLQRLEIEIKELKDILAALGSIPSATGNSDLDKIINKILSIFKLN